jgi:hypothetical protein
MHHCLGLRLRFRIGLLHHGLAQRDQDERGRNPLKLLRFYDP